MLVSRSDLELSPPSAKFEESANDLPLELYNPYPAYNSRTWKKKWHGTHVGCEGPRGVDVNGNEDDTLGAYKVPSGGQNTNQDGILRFADAGNQHRRHLHSSALTRIPDWGPAIVFNVILETVHMGMKIGRAMV